METEGIERLFSLEGKTALVTGASGGIGTAIAKTLFDAGATVALSGTSKSKLTSAAREIGGTSKRLGIFPADLTKVAQCRKLIETVSARLGGLDILVNCAGVNRRKPARDVSEDDFDFITGVNLKSLFFLCQAALPVMRDAGGGKIINIGSVTSTAGLGGVSIYGITKAGVGQLTRTLALEWARFNIQVNCLAPGFIHTPLTATGLWGDAHRRKWLKDRIPMRRAGRPEELAGMTLLLASNASSYITGQVMNVDGGYLAGGSWLRDDE